MPHVHSGNSDLLIPVDKIFFYSVLPDRTHCPSRALETQCPDIDFFVEFLAFNIERGDLIRNGETIKGIGLSGIEQFEAKLSLYGFKAGDVAPEFLADLPQDIDEKRKELCRRFDLPLETKVKHDPKAGYKVLTSGQVEEEGVFLTGLSGKKLTYSLPTVFNNLVKDGFLEVTDEILNKVQENTGADKVEYLPRKSSLRLTFSDIHGGDKNRIPQNIFNVLDRETSKAYSEVREAIGQDVQGAEEEIKALKDKLQNQIDEKAKRYGAFVPNFQIGNKIS